jgi:hypothetical protein
MQFDVYIYLKDGSRFGMNDKCGIVDFYGS